MPGCASAHAYITLHLPSTLHRQLPVSSLCFCRLLLFSIIALAVGLKSTGGPRATDRTPKKKKKALFRSALRTHPCSHGWPVFFFLVIIPSLLDMVSSG